MCGPHKKSECLLVYLYCDQILIPPHWRWRRGLNKVPNEISLFMPVLIRAVRLDRVYTLGTPSPCSLVSICCLCLKHMSHSSLVLHSEVLLSCTWSSVYIFYVFIVIASNSTSAKEGNICIQHVFFLCNIWTVTYWLFWGDLPAAVDMSKVWVFFQIVAKKDELTNQLSKLLRTGPARQKQGVMTNIMLSRL